LGSYTLPLLLTLVFGRQVYTAADHCKRLCRRETIKQFVVISGYLLHCADYLDDRKRMLEVLLHYSPFAALDEKTLLSVPSAAAKLILPFSAR
jgi:hypothetical protein